jgi:hypothetical protein
MAKLSLRESIQAELQMKPEPVKDVLRRAVIGAGWKEKDGVWSHPTLTGKTPLATASTQLLSLQAKGIAAKPEKGMAAMGMEHPDYKGKRNTPVAARKPRSSRATKTQAATA